MRRFFLFCIIFSVNIFCIAQNYKKDSIDSKVLNQKRRLNIIIPDTTLGQINGKMNVVYVLDGCRTFVDLVASHMAYITEMESENCVPAFLVVGIESENTRWDDFMTNGKHRETGRAKEFLSFMSDELFPYIESNYNITNHRVGVGHSLGGSLLMQALCEQDSLFNAYLMISPNFIYANNKLINDFKKKSDSKLSKFVYIACGNVGDPETAFLEGVKKIDTSINASSDIKDLKVKIDYLKNADHNESFPMSIGSALKEYITFNYSIPDENSRMEMLSEDNFADAVATYYESKQPYLGYTFYPGIYALYNKYIALAGQEGQSNKVMQLSDWAIKKYEGNKDQYLLYLAKAYAYDDQGDVKAAIKVCKQALRSMVELRNKYSKEDYLYAESEINSTIEELKNSTNN